MIGMFNSYAMCYKELISGIQPPFFHPGDPGPLKIDHDANKTTNISKMQVSKGKARAKKFIFISTCQFSISMFYHDKMKS